MPIYANSARHTIIRKKHKGREAMRRRQLEKIERKLNKSKFLNVMAWITVFVIIFGVIGIFGYGIWCAVGIVLR